jgi:4-hydroxybenzoate polyprenyltransferase
MFLNDAVDQEYDKRYRAERPIPSGQIRASTVWILAVLLLSTGWITFLLVGRGPALIAGVLVLAIIIYDLIHKHTKLAPVVMASCRFLLYLAAASAANAPQNSNVLWRAAALAAYIIGLSYLARKESGPALEVPAARRLVHWPVALLVLPALIAWSLHSAALWAILIVGFLQIFWVVRCVLMRPTLSPILPAGVAGLLAGIVLVDWVAAVGFGFACAFIGLFLLAFLLQRIAPAT